MKQLAAIRHRCVHGMLALLTGMLLLSGCAGEDAGSLASSPTQEVATTPSPPAASAAGDTARIGASAADAFFEAISAHCGQSYSGRVIVDRPPPPEPDALSSNRLVMHVRSCKDTEVRIPFHVGEDHSRTWVLTRTEDGLRLKHDHRHEDGSPDAVTLYGGDSAPGGSATRMEFPVDAESISNFKANGLEASLNNTWAMEIEPGKRFLYELSRPSGRLFQVAFDLTVPVPTPLAPWGAEPADQNP